MTLGGLNSLMCLAYEVCCRGKSKSSKKS